MEKRCSAEQFALFQVVSRKEREPIKTTLPFGDRVPPTNQVFSKRSWNVEKRHSFYLNILNISRRNIHCTLMVKRYKFITSYKNYHLKVILFI